MVTCCTNCRDKMMITIISGGREGGGQRVMIEIIISENDDNDGRPLRTLKVWSRSNGQVDGV